MTVRDFSKIWENFKRQMELIYELDAKMLQEHGGLIPMLHFNFLCQKCEKFLWVSAVLNVPVDEIRENLPLLAIEIVARAVSVGCSCGGVIVPLGYIFCSESWMIKLDRTKMTEDITPSEHPDRQEAYVMMANTIFGKAGIGFAPIQRQDKEVNLGKLDFIERSPDELSGKLVLPLPQIEMDNIMFG